MQQTQANAAMGAAERKRVEAVVETLAALRGPGESLAGVAHDARNMVTALGLYCDLLEEPGVVAAPFAHYANELRLVAAASRRLVEKLVALDVQANPEADLPGFETPRAEGWTGLSNSLALPVTSPQKSPGTSLETSSGTPIGASFDRRLLRSFDRGRRWEMMPAEPVGNLAAELLANRNLLSALAGPGIALTVDAEGGAQAVRLTAEDLTRVLVNLVKNAAEAMPGGGRILIGLGEKPAGGGAAGWLSVTVEDNGPGIPGDALEKIFESGYTTRAASTAVIGSWPASHRGLGLAICRSLVEGAGGRMMASNRAQGGARFEIELPVRAR
jgi:signal transduction histidine kinase